MSIELNQEQLVIEQPNIEKKKIGLKRYITQITDTISFEIKRTWKTFIVMLIVYLALFLLTFLIFELQEAQKVELPTKSVDYIVEYIDTLGLLIIISTATFGGSIIAEDFQKQTGNLLFPKISKSRLLIGRVISRYALNAILIIFYYVLVASVAIYKYGGGGFAFFFYYHTLIYSLGWALLYTFMIFAFIIFMSSINKSKSATIIASILLLLIALRIITMVLMFTGGGIEPLFMITYYENIITASLDMPDPRYEIDEFGDPDDKGNPEFKRWLTPSASGALIGMIIFSVLLLTAAYLFYKRRQSKSG